MGRGRSLFLVYTNPLPGREGEFGDWYRTVHLPEVLTVPGFVAAQHFRFSPEQRLPSAVSPQSYLAVYEIADSPRQAFANLDARKLSKGEALDPSSSTSIVWDAVTDRITR
jgi:hypothetical protein